MTDAGPGTITIRVSGMTCAACEQRVGRSLRRLPGVQSVRVSARRGSAALTGAPLPSADAIDEAVRSAGYAVEAPRWISPDARLWRAVVLAVLVIAAAAWLVRYSGLTGILPELTDPGRGGLVLVLVLGLTAGISTCMALVGGLVLGISASRAAALSAGDVRAQSFPARMRPQLAFNVGRVVGFGVLGAVLGALGSAVALPTRVMAVLVIAVAVVMSLLGVRLTGVSPRMAAWSPQLPASLSSRLGITPEGASGGEPYGDVRAALAGAATFFLPCGLTQAVQLYALSSGSPQSAGLIMAVFAVGTTPGLLALGAVPEVASEGRQVGVLRVVGVVVLGFALLNATSGLRLLGVAGAGTPASVVAQRVSDNVTLADGVQTVRMTQARAGYAPADTHVYAGIPIRWVIDATSRWDCSAFLRVPDLDVSVNLTQGVNTVDLPALAPGVLPFTCVMGMYSGNLIAIDAPHPANGTS